jgi:hypothetical protein
MATQTITLNSKTGQHLIKAVTQDSTLTCTKTSHPEVYVSAMTDKGQHSLQTGDSKFVEKGTLTLWVFRKTGGTDEFWAQLDLTTP